MIISNNKEAYVWIWLPETSSPVVAGKLEQRSGYCDYFYGQSYLKNPNKISLSKEELPLAEGKRFSSANEIHNVIADSLPDAWGRRVLFHHYQTLNLSAIDILLLSSSDRIGALHFQSSSTQFKTHDEDTATLEELIDAAELIEAGKPLPKTLELAMLHGTSIGGARPKALIETKNKKLIAKLSTSNDLFPIVQAEYVAMRMAKILKINAANVRLEKVKNKYILLVERFDRILHPEKFWSRKFMTSALTLLNLDEKSAHYASYLDLADLIRKYCRDPKKELRELYRRIAFNILIGNTDDHAKNHSFFWDGTTYALAPAYDIRPYPRSDFQATQAMIVGELGAYSLIKNVLSAANHFGLSDSDAKQEIDALIDGIKSHWKALSEEAELTLLQSEQLMGKAVLNPYVFYDQP